MPANSKYLSSPGQRFAKLSAGLLGGYLLSATLHYVLGMWLGNPAYVVVTSIYSLYLVWMLLFIVPYLFTNGWKAWAYYLGIMLALLLLSTL
ncbi:MULTISPECIES: hypothetical protein [Roseivirga]|jgi:hypothetical protein|uniref:hypothetical protein n=1 Tax=Roseivirga TaxID=290180 RepID=UPI00257B916C|nr:MULTISPECIES: hypothetical protein [Roseivirga]|tara:strand:- start:9424 stop:9699 length:276 start_codon:yes stop_codon:yes gene_type:complete